MARYTSLLASDDPARTNRWLPTLGWKVITFAGSTVAVLALIFTLSQSRISTSLSGSLQHGYSLPGMHDPSSLENILNNTLGFQKLLVINLPERTDHRDALTLTGGLTGLQFDWIDGIHGERMFDTALPPGDAAKKLSAATRGSWRAHINAIRTVVEKNLGSALILEDDVDWDIRIKTLLQDTARASRALTQPLRGHTDRFADPTFPEALNEGLTPKGISLDQASSTEEPEHSPYGDNWDVLWLGHCGMRRPVADMGEELDALAKGIPRGYVYHEQDASVPEQRYIHVFDDNGHPRFRQDFPSHTRIWHHPLDAICSLTYAVSQAGARKILHELAVERFDAPYDIMLRQFCDQGRGHGRHTCLTVQPTLFDHHRPVGPMSHESDINYHGDGQRETAVTDNIRWSARLNLAKLIAGDTDYDEQYPDFGQAVK